VTAGLNAPPTGSPASVAALKVDVFRHLASLPFASPEISHLLRQSLLELHEAMTPAVPSPAPVRPAAPGSLVAP
jgi:hypothetical protein